MEKKIEMFCSAVAESAEGGGGCGGPKASEGAQEGVGALDSNCLQIICENLYLSSCKTHSCSKKITLSSTGNGGCSRFNQQTIYEYSFLSF